MQIYRQGDVLIRRVTAIPDGGKRVPSGVLAEGEVTGHAHRIEDLTAAELLECGDGMFLAVGPEGVRIMHEEHAPIRLEPGKYQVVRQNEYAPEAIRSVAD